MISLGLIVPILLLAPHGPVAMHQTHLKVEKHPPLKVEPKKDDKPKVEAKKAEAKVEPKKEEKKVEVKPDPKPCLRYPITVTHGLEEATFPLTTCDGHVAPGAIEQLSLLARPEIIEKPKASLADLMKVPGDFMAPGVKRVDERLPHALQMVLDHFDRTGMARQVHLISGYRPASKGSYHATAQALDFRVDGVSNENIVSFCKTLTDVGCGYYPNSTFVHIDVRPEGTGHVAWIDASGPGEQPQYVSTWPPPVDPFADDARSAYTMPSLPLLPRM
jgi:hypothetical protein